MAQEIRQEGEWFNFSSSNCDDQGKFFETTSETHETAGVREDFTYDTNIVCKLESIRELLTLSLPAATLVRQKQRFSCSPNSSVINECKHQYVYIAFRTSSIFC